MSPRLMNQILTLRLLLPSITKAGVEYLAFAALAMSFLRRSRFPILGIETGGFDTIFPVCTVSRLRSHFENSSRQRPENLWQAPGG